MNIERINQILNKAIVEFQEGELEGLAEKAVLGGYKVKSPSAFGVEPEPPWREKMMNLNYADYTPLTKILGKKLQGLKKDIPGVVGVKMFKKEVFKGKDVERKYEVKFKGKNAPFGLHIVVYNNAVHLHVPSPKDTRRVTSVVAAKIPLTGDMVPSKAYNSIKSHLRKYLDNIGFDPKG